MSRKLKGYLISYASALVATGMGVFLRVAIVHFTGPGLATYITFYPFIIFVAIFGGSGPGILITLASALVVHYWFLSPPETFTFLNLADAVGMALFIIMGALISVVVGLYRRKNEKQIEELRLSDIEQKDLTQKLKESYRELEEKVRVRSKPSHVIL